MVRTALALYDAAQAQYGGAQSDANAERQLLGLIASYSDDELERRIGIGIGVASSRYWEDTQAPTPHYGGKQLYCAITGNWQELEFDQAPPLTPQQYFWSDDHATFVDEVGFDPLGQKVGKEPLQALSEVTPEPKVFIPSDPSPAPSTAKQFPKQQKAETYESQPKRYRIWSAEDLDRMNAPRQSITAHGQR